MIAAIAGGLLGVGAGALSVGSLWLITGMTARAASGLSLPPVRERPTGWDLEAQNPDVVTAGSLLRFRREETQEREMVDYPETPSTWEATPAEERRILASPPSADPPTVPPFVPQGEPSPEGRLRRATLRVLFALLLKAPLLVLVALGAQRLGTDALHWCVGGVVSVYSLAVFWAAARTRQG